LGVSAINYVSAVRRHDAAWVEVVIGDGATITASRVRSRLLREAVCSFPLAVQPMQRMDHAMTAASHTRSANVFHVWIFQDRRVASR